MCFLSILCIVKTSNGLATGGRRGYADKCSVKVGQIENTTLKVINNGQAIKNGVTLLLPL